MLEPASPLPALLCLILAVATTALLALRFAPPSAQGRFATIDGLRGYLAFFVFLHHACIWQVYARTGVWKLPPSSRLYTHLGQSSVAAFFMNTGLLFFTKIIDARTTGIDWAKLYVSRVMRLVPLYLFAMALVFLIVAVLSKGAINDSAGRLLKVALKWLTFTLAGSPDLNGVKDTSLVIAGVTWSLTYEWLFYLSLPLLALATGNVPALPWILAGLVGVIGFATKENPLPAFGSFAGGVAAAGLIRVQVLRRFAPTPLASVLVVALIVATVAVFPSAYAPIPFVLLSVSFALIAGGNSLFGALSHPISRMFGESAYSIYLLHGIVLFTVFQFAVGRETAATLSSTHHWLVIMLMSPVLVIVTFFTFRWIEQPGMRATDAMTARLRRLFAGRPAAAGERI